MAVFQLDRAHTNINFSAKHLMVTSVRGEFLDFDATLDLDEADPTRSSAEFRVKTASIDTGFAARDNPLRSADFFDAETYPELVVRSTRIRHKRGNDYAVTADVTIRDVTRPVDFDVEFLGFFPGMDGARHVGFSAKARVNHKEWGLDWNVALEAGGWLVGDEIRLDVEVAAQEPLKVVAETAAAA
jgi:polyisoprenoid-binding protein YceI